MAHTTKLRNSTLQIIHNSDYSGEITLLSIDAKTGKETEMQIDGPDFQELCEEVAADTIMEKINGVLGR